MEEDVRKIVESCDSHPERCTLWAILANLERRVALKKTYQISRRRAVEKFQKLALANPTPIQLTFPLADIAELAQTSLGDLLRGVGKAFIESVMEVEVEELAGKRSQPN